MTAKFFYFHHSPILLKMLKNVFQDKISYACLPFTLSHLLLNYLAAGAGLEPTIQFPINIEVCLKMTINILEPEVRFELTRPYGS